MPKLFITLLLFFLFFNGIAQFSLIDSLKAKLAKYPNDTNSVNTLVDISIACNQIGAFKQSREYAKRAAELSQKINFPTGIHKAISSKGLSYYFEGNFPEAMKVFFLQLRLAEKNNDENSLLTAYGDIALVLKAQGAHDQAILYLNKALALCEKKHMYLFAAQNYNNLGNIYMELENLDEAEKNYLKSYEINTRIHEDAQIITNLGNLGTIQFYKGDHKKALDYLQQSIEGAKKLKDNYVLTMCLINISRVYTELKKPMEASMALQECWDVAGVANFKDMLETYYYVKASVDNLKHDFAEMNTDYKLSKFYHDSIDNADNIRKSIQESMTYEFEKKEEAINIAQAKKDAELLAAEKKRKLISNCVISVLVLISFVTLFVTLRIRNKRKKDKINFEYQQQVTENEKQIITEEKLQVEEDLALAQQQLKSYTENLIEKNSRLIEIETEYEKLKEIKSGEIIDNRNEHLSTLSNLTILTPEDWDRFKHLFEQVHKGYFVRLKEKLPDLTPAEVRLVCLHKLKLETREMASVLGVSVDTIKKTRHRLRKKMSLPETEKIETIASKV